MTPITPEELMKLEELEKKATKGPWGTGGNAWSAYDDEQGLGDCAFINALRNAFPSIVQALKEKDAEIERLEKLVEIGMQVELDNCGLIDELNRLNKREQQWQKFGEAIKKASLHAYGRAEYGASEDIDEAIKLMPK